jgi:hypothetical protein
LIFKESDPLILPWLFIARGWRFATRSRNLTLLIFESFRRSLEDLMSRATPPEERRAIVARMRDTLVQAKVGLEEMREGLAKSRARLAAEERELETVLRRKQLAEGIGDKETVDVAARYEAIHRERADVARRKLEAQEAELALAERDVNTMTAELKAAVSGAPLGAGAAAAAQAVEDPGAHSAPDGEALSGEIDALGRARARAERDADADRKLEELKRRMGR